MNHCRFECWSEKIQRIVSKEKTLEKKKMKKKRWNLKNKNDQ